MKYLLEIHSPGSGSVKPADVKEHESMSDALLAAVDWSRAGFSVRIVECESETT